MQALLRKGAGAAGAVGAALFATLFCVFVVQVAARFGFNKPIPWTDELAVVLYVWVILWCAAFVVPEREHVVFDLVWNSLGRRSRLVMRIAGNLMIGGLSLVALPASAVIARSSASLSAGVRASRRGPGTGVKGTASSSFG